jgi:hypothetical protein
MPELEFLDVHMSSTLLQSLNNYRPETYGWRHYDRGVPKEYDDLQNHQKRDELKRFTLKHGRSRLSVDRDPLSTEQLSAIANKATQAVELQNWDYIDLVCYGQCTCELAIMMSNSCLDQLRAEEKKLNLPADKAEFLKEVQQHVA